MHSLKKKVILTSLIVIFAMFATIGATFAWFTIDSSSSIDEVQLTVGSDVSLLIMMDQGYTYAANQTLLDNPANGQYVTQLTTSMITSVYDYREIVFEPVTTANGSTYTLRNGGSASASPTLPGAYIEFSVWILSQAAASNVAIRNLEIQSSNSIIFKNVTANAVRLSIQNQANSVFIFGNDKDYSFTYRADQIWYDSSVPANNSIASATATALGLLHSKYYTTGSVVAAENTGTLTEADTVVSLLADVPQKLTIRIWIEGWDKDANNNIMSALLTVKFEFAVQL